MPFSAGDVFFNNYVGFNKLENVEAKNLHFNPDSSGYHILYNVPSGKKVLNIGTACANTTALSQGYVPCLCVSGVYYRLNTEISVTTMSFGYNNSTTFLACSGESIALYVTASGLNSYSRILEFNENANIKSIKKIDNWASGFNLVYTATNKGTIILDIGGGFNGTLQSIRYSNQSTASRNFRLFVVPNGQSTDLHNAFALLTTSIANNSIAVIGGVFLSSGDAMYAYTDGSGHQSMFCMGIEL